MNRISKESDNSAFTRIELAVVVAVLALLTLILLPALAQDAQDSPRKRCVNNLRQCGLAFRVWEGDNNDKFPMAVSTGLGGTKEFVKDGNAFRHFQVVSNELNTPKILICPSDTRTAAGSFADFQNKNLSYFIGLDATEMNPQMILVGDRNVENGKEPVHSVLELRPELPVHWTEAMHTNQGDILLTDGSVQQISNNGLQNAIKVTDDPINRVALPE
jgi:type II secretory pathway pseudopilin PulG